MTTAANKKVGLTQADLEKGMATLEAAAKAPGARATQLFNKAQTGNITPEEREELVKSFSGESTLATQATKGLKDNDVIEKSMDVSDYLREQHAGVVTGLEVLAAHLEKSSGNEIEFRTALATSVVQQGQMLKSFADQLGAISERLGIIAAQPARAPKSTAAAAAAAANGMNKSFGGGTAPTDELSKSQIEDAMTDMISKGMQLAGGENLMIAATKYEGSNEISSGMLKAVTDHIRKNKAA